MASPTPGRRSSHLDKPRMIRLAPWSPVATHAVDVTENDAGVSSLRAHPGYLRGLGSDPVSDPDEFLAGPTRPVGASIDTRYGVAFEVIAACLMNPTAIAAVRTAALATSRSRASERAPST